MRAARLVLLLSAIQAFTTLFIFAVPALKKTVVSGSNIVSSSPVQHLTTYTPMYVSLAGEYEPTDIQCPIPMENRVPNYTGVQCVWASIEMLGRWAEEPRLVNPPLTSRADCKSYSSPELASQVLTRLGVKFEQSYNNTTKGVALIKKAMEEGRGCLFSVTGHAMVIVHYDEEKGIVKWVDNSDSTLKVQTMNMERFRSVWTSWVLVIYADNDIVSSKLNRFANIPIVDRNNEQGTYDRGYIPHPKLR